MVILNILSTLVFILHLETVVEKNRIFPLKKSSSKIFIINNFMSEVYSMYNAVFVQEKT